ncbi:MAG: pitrilysin family protein [Deltaproteobacteria bacterium]
MRLRQVLSSAAFLFLSTCPTAASAFESQRATLDNGLRLVMSEQKSVPIVSIDCLVDGGARIDPRDRPGLAGITADLLDEGTRAETAREIARRIDSIGGSFGTGAAYDWTHIGAAVLARDFTIAMDLIANSLRYPTFPEAEVERVRRETLGGLEAAEENPGGVAARTFRQALYGDASYGHPVAGTPAAVQAITRAEILAFHQRSITPDQTICAIVGDIATDQMLATARAKLGDWQGVAVLSKDRLTTPPASREIRIDRPVTQANIVIGQLGVARDNADYFPILLMNHILGGGGFTSRLMQEIRTRKGLAYSVYSRFSSNRLPGPFRVVLQTRAQTAGEAIAIVRREISRMHRNGVSAEELAAAQDFLTGSFPLRLDSTAKLSGLLAQIEYFGLGDDYIERYGERVRSVTLAEVAAAARRHLRPEDLIVVAVGPEVELSQQGFSATE